MARATTAAERTTQDGRHYVVHAWVECTDAAGQWRSLSGEDPSLGAGSWVESLTWGATVEQPVQQGTLTLRRTRTDRAGVTRSLAPLMQESPVLDVGSLVRAYTATLPPGAERAPGPRKSQVSAGLYDAQRGCTVMLVKWYELSRISSDKAPLEHSILGFSQLQRATVLPRRFDQAVEHNVSAA